MTINTIVETETYLRSLTVNEYHYGQKYLQWLLSDQHRADDFPKPETWSVSLGRAIEIADKIREIETGVNVSTLKP